MPTPRRKPASKSKKQSNGRSSKTAARSRVANARKDEEQEDEAEEDGDDAPELKDSEVMGEVAEDDDVDMAAPEDVHQDQPADAEVEELDDDAERSQHGQPPVQVPFSEATVNDSISGSEVVWHPTTRSRRLVATHVEIPPTRRNRTLSGQARSTEIRVRPSGEGQSRSVTLDLAEGESSSVPAGLPPIAEEEEEREYEERREEHDGEQEEEEQEEEQEEEEQEQDQTVAAPHARIHQQGDGDNIDVEAALEVMYNDSEDSGSDYSEGQREIRKQRVRRGQEPEEEEDEEEDKDKEDEDEDDNKSKRRQSAGKQKAKQPTGSSRAPKEKRSAKSRLRAQIPANESRAKTTPATRSRKPSNNARSHTLDRVEEPQSNGVDADDPVSGNVVDIDDAPDIEDDGVIYVGGPLPQWAKDEAVELRAEYKAKIHTLALTAKKPDRAIYRHLNTIDQDPDLRGTSPWNAFLAWYNVEGDEKKPKDCLIQDWNRYVSKLYKEEVEARVPEDQREDSEAIREGMADFIDRADGRYGLYIDDMKRNDPKKFEKKLTDLAAPFLQMANKVYEQWGVHAFGYILSTEYDGTVSGPGFAWGASPQYLLVKEKCQAQITRTLQDFTTHFRCVHMENKIVDVELVAELDRKPGESARERDRRLLGKFVVNDALRLLGEKNGVNIHSFVNKAMLKEIRIRNWPVGISVPGANGVTLNTLNTQSLRAIVQLREEYLKLLVQGREAEAKTPYFTMEKWTKEEQELESEVQEKVAIVTFADKDSSTAVFANGTCPITKSADEEADDEEGGGEEETANAQVETSRRKKGKHTARSVPGPTLPLYADDEETPHTEVEPRSQPAAQHTSQRHAVVPTTQDRPHANRERQPRRAPAPVAPRPVSPPTPCAESATPEPPPRQPPRIVARSEYRKIPSPRTTHTRPQVLYPEEYEYSTDEAALHRLQSPHRREPMDTGSSIEHSPPPIQRHSAAQPPAQSTDPEPAQYPFKPGAIQRELREFEENEERVRQEAKRQIERLQWEERETCELWANAELEGPPTKKRKLKDIQSPIPVAVPPRPTRGLPSRAKSQSVERSQIPPNIRYATPGSDPKATQTTASTVNAGTGPSKPRPSNPTMVSRPPQIKAVPNAVASSSNPTMVSRRPAQPTHANTVAGPSNPTMLSRRQARTTSDLGLIDLRQQDKPRSKQSRSE
ncbi:hypothetical protein V5O48_015993 [Marasmius crinis-equi]|uniref:Uncharacterized protein n=1 Tax=Marasmius crinis-equi TaxID=585013 RepID=A0ABR3ESZ3_9AGAR